MTNIKNKVFYNFMASETAFVSALVCITIGKGALSGILFFVSFLLFFNAIKLILDTHIKNNKEDEENGN